MNKKTLILGSDGSLGSLILQRAIDAYGATEVIAGYYTRNDSITEKYPDIEFRQVDIRNEASLAAAMKDVITVISAVPQVEPLLQKVAAELDVNSVDVGAHYEVAQKAIDTIEALSTFHLVCAGQAPGITGLMAKKLHSLTSGAVDVGFLLADNGRSGRSGVADMLRLIDTSSKKPIDFEYYRTGKRKSVPLEVNEMSIAKGHTVPMESVVAFQNNIQNKLALLLKQLKLLRIVYTKNWLLDRLAKPAKSTENEVIYLGAASSGQRIDIHSKSDYLAAAYAAVAFAELAVEQSLKGVTVPGATSITLEQVINRCDGVISEVS